MSLSGGWFPSAKININDLIYKFVMFIRCRGMLGSHMDFQSKILSQILMINGTSDFHLPM